MESPAGAGSSSGYWLVVLAIAIYAGLAVSLIYYFSQEAR